MKNFLLVILALLTSQLSHAGVAPKYTGEFRFEPKSGHSAPIDGALTLTSNDGVQFIEVLLVPSIPVYGKKELRSDTLVTQYLTTGNAEKLALIMSLKGTPHKFFFVWLLTSIDGGITYEATFYKVSGKLEEIQQAITHATTLPIPTWKLVGVGLAKT